MLEMQWFYFVRSHNAEISTKEIMSVTEISRRFYNLVNGKFESKLRVVEPLPWTIWHLYHMLYLKQIHNLQSKIWFGHDYTCYSVETVSSRLIKNEWIHMD